MVRRQTPARWLAPSKTASAARRLRRLADRAGGSYGYLSGSRRNTFKVILDQYRALPQTYRQEREVTSLGSIPPIVVSATTPDDEKLLLARAPGKRPPACPAGGPCHDRHSRGRPPGSFATRCATDPTTASRLKLSERTEQILTSRDWLSPMQSVS